MTTYSELREAIIFVNEAVAHLNEEFAKIKPLTPVQYSAVPNFSPDMPQYIRDIIDNKPLIDWNGLGAEASDYAMIKVLNNNGQTCSYEKGLNRFFAKANSIEQPQTLDELKVDEFYMVHYIPKTRGKLMWAIKLSNQNPEDFKNVARTLSAKTLANEPTRGRVVINKK